MCIFCLVKAIKEENDPEKAKGQVVPFPFQFMLFHILRSPYIEIARPFNEIKNGPEVAIPKPSTNRGTNT